MELSRENVKFVEWKVVNKKDWSGEICFLSLQHTYAQWTEKEFTKIDNKVINAPTDELKKLLKELKMWDIITLSLNLV